MSVLETWWGLLPFVFGTWVVFLSAQISLGVADSLTRPQVAASGIATGLELVVCPSLAFVAAKIVDMFFWPWGSQAAIALHALLLAVSLLMAALAMARIGHHLLRRKLRPAAGDGR